MRTRFSVRGFPNSSLTRLDCHRVEYRTREAPLNRSLKDPGGSAASRRGVATPWEVQTHEEHCGRTFSVWHCWGPDGRAAWAVLDVRTSGAGAEPPPWASGVHFKSFEDLARSTGLPLQLPPSEGDWMTHWRKLAR